MTYSVPVNLIILFSFVIFVFYVFGIHNILTKIDENACEMTYMYEYPQFVEISFPSVIQQRFPQYALYGYGEGGHTEQLRKMRFNGIPVLFLPGSGGSYKQGRSLASISLRKWLNSRTTYHFDFFMADFNEELSGTYGGILDEQVKFTGFCIEKILSLYRNDSHSLAPTSVILIGHSFGGLVAKGIFVKPEINPQLVNLIITLSAPHKYPVIQPDSYISTFYQNLEETWSDNSQLGHITLISIGGGNRDLIVRSDLTYDKHSKVNVLSSAVPGVWCRNDHLSVVWCKQLVMTIVRALFDNVDLTTKQIFSNHAVRESIWRYHLLKRNNGKRYSLANFSRYVSFEKGGNWLENLQRQFTVLETRGLKVNHYLMIRLLSDPKHAAAFIETYNLNTKDWLFVCTADIVHNSVRMCQVGENISNLTDIAPSQKVRRKHVYLNLLNYKEQSFTHVVVKLPPLETFVQVNVDIHNPADRRIVHTVPKIYSPSRSVVIESTLPNALYYEIALSGFESVWQAFKLHLEVLSCKTGTNHAVASFGVPWSNEDIHSFAIDKASITKLIRLITPRPTNYNKTELPTVKLNLDPSCKYKVSLETSLIGAAGQIARYYTPMIPAYVAAIALLTLRQELLYLNENGESQLFHSALATAVRPYYILLQATILGSKILGLGICLTVLPVPDFFTLQELNLDFFVLTILLYGIAVIIVYTLGIVCYVTIIVSGQAAHKMALRFIAKTVTGFVSWSEWIFSALHQVPFVVASVLVSLALSTSGGLALWLGTIFYFLKLCKMYEDYLENLFHYSIKLVARKLRNVTKSKPKEENSEPDEKKSTGKETPSKQVAEKAPPDEGACEENDREKTEEAQGANAEGKEETSSEANEAAAMTVLQNPEKSVQEKRGLEKSKGLLSDLHFHISVFLVWFLAASLYIPSVLVWAKNYHYSILLVKDPAIVPSIIFSICGAFLWQGGVPHSCGKLSQITSAIMFALAATTIIYSSVSLYRLGYILSASMVVLTVNQVVGRLNQTVD